MNDEKLAEIRARHQASWRGPYQWLGYGGRQRKTIDLALTTQYHGKEYIMSFERSGLNRAVPKFWPHAERYGNPGLRDLIEYEVSYRDDFTKIHHPDAIAIAKSWEDREDLLAEVDRLRDEVAQLQILLTPIKVLG